MQHMQEQINELLLFAPQDRHGLASRLAAIELKLTSPPVSLPPVTLPISSQQPVPIVSLSNYSISCSCTSQSTSFFY